MNALADFLSQEAGQRRREWLDQQAAGVANALSYYLGPELSQSGGRVVNALAFMNPVQDVGDAMAAGRDGRYVDMLTNTASAVAPVIGGYAAKRVNPQMVDDAAQWLQDAVMGFSVNPTRAGLSDAGRNWLADEYGGIKAYHGSPYDFDKFSMDKIGTGEGAQDLGRGLYFYDEPIPAEGYRNPAARWFDVEAMKRYSEKGPGRVYEVDIDARPDQLLDENMKAADLPDGTRMAARRDAKIEAETDPVFKQTLRDHMQVRHISDGAERDILEDGYVGLKRKKYGGETEYVVFDENLIEIVKKYGIAGAAAMLGVSAADVQSAMGGEQY